MSIVVECVCGGKFRVKDEFAGKMIRCTKCQSPVSVPTAAPVRSSAPKAAVKPVQKAAKPPAARPTQTPVPAQQLPQQQRLLQPAAPIQHVPGATLQPNFGTPPATPPKANVGSSVRGNSSKKLLFILLGVGAAGFLLLAATGVTVAVLVFGKTEGETILASLSDGVGPLTDDVGPIEQKPGQLWFSISNLKIRDKGKKEVVQGQKRIPVQVISFDWKTENRSAQKCAARIS